MNKFLVAVPVLALAAPLAWADRPIDEHRPLSADASVSVLNTAGVVDVEAWDKNELQLTGELADEVEKLDISGTPGNLRIEVKLPRNAHDVGDTKLKLKVPAGTRLRASTVSADVSVRGLNGAAVVKSVSGDILVRGGSQDVEAESVSGRVQLDVPATTLRVQTVSGDVKVHGASGEIHGETVSGDVSLDAHAVRKFSAETVSGDLSLDFDFAKDPEVRIETLSGEVTMRLPALPDATLELETFSGDMSSEWEKIGEDAKDYRHDGSGKGLVRVHSFSGDISLKKR